MLLVTPTTLASKNFRPAPGTESDAAVSNFSDPEKYPLLYEEKVRLDTDHLNTPGAVIFTRLVAERFAEQELGKK